MARAPNGLARPQSATGRTGCGEALDDEWELELADVNDFDASMSAALSATQLGRSPFASHNRGEPPSAPPPPQQQAAGAADAASPAKPESAVSSPAWKHVEAPLAGL